MNHKQVYVLLTDTGTLFTRAIKLYTKKPYNHASIAFDEDLTEVYSFGRKNPRNPFIGGFVKEEINKGLFKNATCGIYRLTINETDYNRMKQYIQTIDAQKEKYCYNFLGLIAIIFNKELNRKNAFFCSQFVATVLKHSDEVNIHIPLSFVTPYDLQLVENLEFVYQGKLHDYNKVLSNSYHTNQVPSQANIVSA